MEWTSAALASHNATPPPLNLPPHQLLLDALLTITAKPKSPRVAMATHAAPYPAHTHTEQEEVWRRRLSSDADGGRNTFFFPSGSFVSLGPSD